MCKILRLLDDLSSEVVFMRVYQQLLLCACVFDPFVFCFQLNSFHLSYPRRFTHWSRPVVLLVLGNILRHSAVKENILQDKIFSSLPHLFLCEL